MEDVSKTNKPRKSEKRKLAANQESIIVNYKTDSLNTIPDTSNSKSMIPCNTIETKKLNLTYSSVDANQKIDFNKKNKSFFDEYRKNLITEQIACDINARIDAKKILNKSVNQTTTNFLNSKLLRVFGLSKSNLNSNINESRKIKLIKFKPVMDNALKSYTTTMNQLEKIEKQENLILKYQIGEKYNIGDDIVPLEDLLAVSNNEFIESNVNIFDVFGET